MRPEHISDTRQQNLHSGVNVAIKKVTYTRALWNISRSLSYTHTHEHTHTHTHTHTTSPLTLADVFVLLKARFAHTPPDGHQPASIRTAVHLRSLELLGGVDAHAVDLHQRRVPARYRVGELGQVEHGEGTLLVEDPDRDQSDAGAQVLEGQVETLFTQVADVAHLRVQLHHAVADIHLWTEDTHLS